MNRRFQRPVGSPAARNYPQPPVLPRKRRAENSTPLLRLEEPNQPDPRLTLDSHVRVVMDPSSKTRTIDDYEAVKHVASAKVGLTHHPCAASFPNLDTAMDKTFQIQSGNQGLDSIPASTKTTLRSKNIPTFYADHDQVKALAAKIEYWLPHSTHEAITLANLHLPDMIKLSSKLGLHYFKEDLEKGAEILKRLPPGFEGRVMPPCNMAHKHAPDTCEDGLSYFGRPAIRITETETRVLAGGWGTDPNSPHQHYHWTRTVDFTIEEFDARHELRKLQWAYKEIHPEYEVTEQERPPKNDCTML